MQVPTVEDLEGASSLDSELSDEPCDDSLMARQLALIMERLAILESRLDRFEERGSVTGRRTAQGSSSYATAAMINNPTLAMPATPATSRGTRKFKPNATFFSPTQRSSPRHVYASHPAGSQPSGQVLSQVTSMMQSINLPGEGISGSPRPKLQKPLPAHYFGLDPIPTPGQFELQMAKVAEGRYYVVTQGLEIGAFQDWPTVVAIAKNAGGVWRRADSKAQAIKLYRDAYNGGLCRRFENI